ncbi:MAG: 2-oxoacid:acceptor oxidoreductase subunit alpha [Candidatus Poseidoniia archaeon]|jgi:2-oxoglutarate ferredoxin oxidoreductase subunit alpha|nr:2-oxoacid:acceptor oxidoreductase subunit alpha [Candidatus Poseidoniia archaeon]MDP6533791.1 2-oxoacid:acceptor oxidoreductase subunit alpha [Candidatus Poseidoniia archaeon]MDP6834761.1 2-oxoacid:acceptor oxidoreductase subunit alpha [Candidatus Poseidoniia archaeon]MDP7007634.1 2-oxoacid:acceptor oxidoreductase subunit alpha [Candidatus Poseidoniia archaeon]|tara:strand:- start:4830 stop:5987 length:1158 start_codon:yes stop_codon:yes gene_type:complete
MVIGAETGAVLTGTHFLKGDYAAAEGAIASGCRFFAGYPITPATEVASRMAARLDQLGGNYIQMEDELASMAALLGASNAGVKSMTATSGPGLSLMLENIGLGFMTETPCVIINVQRGGPSTGLPTLVGQQDMLQARWGSHGDYETVAYVPASVQEMFDLTVKAFNTSEALRLPVFVLADQAVGHMTGRLVIPPADDVEVVNRATPTGKSNRDFKPFDASQGDIPPMAHAGEGYGIHVTGLTHDERGYPAITSTAQARLQQRLLGKVRNRVDELVMVEEIQTDDAKLIVIAYGSLSRSVLQAINIVREEGLKVGMLRLIAAWPFPSAIVRAAAERAQSLLVAEINMGQMIHPVREVTSCPVHSYHHAGGELSTPQELVARIREVY